MALYPKKNITLSDEIVEYILTREINQLEIISVKSIAQDLNISRYRLSRCFQKDKKISLEEYIFRIKVTQAAFLLQARPEMTVKDIAEKIGYYCYDYFIRIFKRYFGTTPGRYRELKLCIGSDIESLFK